MFSSLIPRAGLGPRQDKIGLGRTVPRSWQNYATSGAVHVIAIALLCVITFPAVHEIVHPREHVTLIAPRLQLYKPKILRPLIRRSVVLKSGIILLKPTVIPLPIVKPPAPKPQLLAKAPEIKEVAPVQHFPEPNFPVPTRPKPEVHTGVFGSNDVAKAPRLAKELKVGGFGAPIGVSPSSDSRPTRLMMARLGGFDLPSGEGPGGGGGQSQSGRVKAAGFGSVGDPLGVVGGTGANGSVRTGGFGDGTVAERGSLTQARPVQPAATPVEIVFKPKPVYTPEAQRLKLEGQVSLQVVFLAAGGVRVVHVVHGLGHGLDEAAEQAATQVRFHPAMRGGVPIDTDGTIYITFALT